MAVISEPLLDATQYGCLSDQSLVTKIFGAIKMDFEAIDRGLDADRFFMDYIDVENHESLCAKLARLRIFDLHINWIREFLTGTLF